MSEPELNVDIPNVAGWPTQSVDSICSLISRGTAPVYVEHSEVLAIGQRCVASTGFAPNFARPHSHRAMRNVLKPESGDVLLNSTGTGTIGRSVVFNSPGTFIVDGHVTVMRPRAELADSRWLNSVLRTPAFQRHLERFCFAGSTNQLELSRTPLRVSRIPTPHIDDQRAMGLVIDTLDTAIHETEAIIAKLKAVKQGLLHDLLTRGIDANGELRPPQAEAPNLYKSSPLGWIPAEWDSVTLSACSLKIADRDHTTPRYVEDGVLIVSPTNLLSDEGIDFVSSKRISRRAHEINCKKTDLAPGDIILHRIGAGLGRVRLVTAEMPEFSILHSMAQIRPNLNAMTSHFMLWAMRTESTKNQMGLGTQSIGVPDLGLDKISNFIVPKPPLEEQLTCPPQPYHANGEKS